MALILTNCIRRGDIIVAQQFRASISTVGTVINLGFYDSLFSAEASA
jgi:hypothetical protein